jgi:hypothetical protein
MKNQMIVFVLCLTFASPLFAQKKEEQRIANSATVLQQLLAGDKGLPAHVLDQADCVVILDSYGSAHRPHRSTTHRARGAECATAWRSIKGTNLCKSVQQSFAAGHADLRTGRIPIGR